MVVVGAQKQRSGPHEHPEICVSGLLPDSPASGCPLALHIGAAGLVA